RGRARRAVESTGAVARGASRSRRRDRSAAFGRPGRSAPAAAAQEAQIAAARPIDATRRRADPRYHRLRAANRSLRRRAGAAPRGRRMAIFIFFLGTLVFAYFSWRYAIVNPRRQGPYRFVVFEGILALVLMNDEAWFSAPASAVQIVSWIALALSI